jgi:hypothetical protein
MPLPKELPKFPERPAEFARSRLDGLRTLLITANGFAKYPEIVHNVDNREVSQFAHGRDLDFRDTAVKIARIYQGVYEFYKWEAPDRVVKDLDHLLTRVYMPADANLFESYSRYLHRLYGVPDLGNEHDHRWLRGVYALYRYGEVIAGENTIVKSAMLIEQHIETDHTFLSFKIVYPSTNVPPSLAKLRQSEPPRTGDQRRIHGVVLAKQKHIHFLGRDRNGDLPYLIIADHPVGRHEYIRSLFVRLATSGQSMASTLLFVRQDHGKGDPRTFFKSMYPSLRVYPARQLIKADRIEDQAWAMDNTVGPQRNTAVLWQPVRPLAHSATTGKARR